MQDSGAPQTLADVVGPLGQDQALRILAIFNRYLHADDACRAETPDAA
jgi:hypothetical protein